MDERIIDKLKSWGCDIENGLARFLDDKSLYCSCLEMFAEDEAFGKLMVAVAEGDYEDAFNQAHTLKGVAGNLGLTPLFDALSVLVEELRNGGRTALDVKLKEIMKQKDTFIQFVKNN